MPPMGTSRPQDLGSAADNAKAIDHRIQTAMLDPKSSNQSEPDLSLTFYSRPIYLGCIRHMLDALCERMGLTPKKAARICLAIDEAICNVIRHGYDNQPDGRIQLDISRIEGEEPELQIDILDRAKTVDLDTIRSRDLKEVRPGGLGVHIIQEIMTYVEYSHREGGGMRLRMKHALPKNNTKGSLKADG